jgi:hypothetical protein
MRTRGFAAQDCDLGGIGAGIEMSAEVLANLGVMLEQLSAAKAKDPISVLMGIAFGLAATFCVLMLRLVGYGAFWQSPLHFSSHPMNPLEIIILLSSLAFYVKKSGSNGGAETDKCIIS